MKPSDIKAAMLKLGITQREIALVTNAPPTRISEAINGRITKLEYRQAVANAIERELIEVFPDEAYRRASGRICKPSAYFQRAMASA